MRQDFVLKIKRLAGRVSGEVHRMHAFVRFQKLSDGLYAATISPEGNVLPLIGDHFEKRYADQRWLIYDVRRDQGIYYDLKRVVPVQISLITLDDRQQIPHAHLAADELFFQGLWKNYFESVNIPERKNLRLQLRHLPRRYWKYLPEKFGF